MIEVAGKNPRATLPPHVARMLPTITQMAHFLDAGALMLNEIEACDLQRVVAWQNGVSQRRPKKTRAGFDVEHVASGRSDPGKFQEYLTPR